MLLPEFHSDFFDLCALYYGPHLLLFFLAGFILGFGPFHELVYSFLRGLKFLIGEVIVPFLRQYIENLSRTIYNYVNLIRLILLSAGNTIVRAGQSLLQAVKDLFYSARRVWNTRTHRGPPSPIDTKNNESTATSETSEVDDDNKPLSPNVATPDRVKQQDLAEYQVLDSKNEVADTNKVTATNNEPSESPNVSKAEAPILVINDTTKNISPSTTTDTTKPANIAIILPNDAKVELNDTDNDKSPSPVSPKTQVEPSGDDG